MFLIKLQIAKFLYIFCVYPYLEEKNIIAKYIKIATIILSPMAHKGNKNNPRTYVAFTILTKPKARYSGYLSNSG